MDLAAIPRSTAQRVSRESIAVRARSALDNAQPARLVRRNVQKKAAEYVHEERVAVD